jgi:hypothetical protein
MRKAWMFALAVASFATPTYAVTMTPAQIESELIGKVLCATTQQGKTICVRHKAGGKSEVVSGGEKQTGVWRFKGNKHCTTWQKIRKGKEFCSLFDKTGDSYSNSSAGKITVK